MADKKGFALLVTLGVTSALLLILVSYIFLVSNELQMAARIHDNAQAHYLAEAGIARMFMWLKHEDSTEQQDYYFPLPGYTLDPGIIVRVDETPETYTHILPSRIITSIANYRGVTKTISVEIRQESYADYAYFISNYSDAVGYVIISAGLYLAKTNPIWFSAHHLTDGPFHTNSNLLIGSNPIFDGPITCGDYVTYIYPETDPPVAADPDYRQGLTTSVPFIWLPDSTLLDSIQSAAAGELPAGDPDNWSLTGPTTITLNNDGTMDVINAGKYPDLPHQSGRVQLPANKAIYVGGVDGDVSLSGTLNGQLTIGTNLNINIRGDIKYVADPLQSGNIDTTNVLGLVAGRSLQVDADALAAGLNNIEVDAYIVALQRNIIPGKPVPPKIVPATVSGGRALQIVGGITEDVPWPIFVSGSNEQIYGMDVAYDKRFAKKVTPLVPPVFTAISGECGTMYRKISWKEN